MKAISKLCKCGCKTVLIWYEKKGYITSKIITTYMEQTVFCPNETNQND